MQEIVVPMGGGVSVELPDLEIYKCDISSKLSSTAGEQCTSDASGEDVISQLTSAFEEVLQLQNTEVDINIDSPLGANSGSDMGVMMKIEKSRAHEHDKSSPNAPPSTSVKCLCKSATFSVADSEDKANASESQEIVSCLRSMSLPVQKKVISAIKGSREKEGLPLRKLSVTWAPDVYDPIPSSVSHLPKKKNNQQYRYSNKKHGKGKNNKSKNSRGSSKKDKKHHREEPSLGKCKFSMDSIAVAGTEKKSAMDDPPISVAGTEKIVSNNFKSAVELLDFDNEVDSPDSNCGSSFLRKSRGTLHFPYAETT